jgi:hypothetical protein
MSKEQRKFKLEEEGAKLPNSIGPGRYKDFKPPLDQIGENAIFKSGADRMTYLNKQARRLAIKQN